MDERRFATRLYAVDPVNRVHEAIQQGATHIHSNQIASQDEGRFAAAVHQAEAQGLVVEGRVGPGVYMYGLDGQLLPEWAY
jgi:hypothetical protein